MKTILFGILVFSSLPAFGAGEKQLSELDKEIIGFFREEEIGTGGIDYPDLKTYYEKLDWYWGQGQKARPALMYLLTEIYEGDFPNMARTIAALSKMDGDRSDILSYVRERLPKMTDIEVTSTHIGYIGASLRVLAKYGQPSDMELIRSFLNHPDVVVRSGAMTEQRNLQSRIDAGEFDKPKVRRKPLSNRAGQNHQESSVPDVAHNEKTIKENRNNPKIGFFLFLSASFLAVALFFWKWPRKKRTSNAPS